MQTTHARSFLFPPPAFLTMPAVGIDISDRSVRFAELLGSKGHYKIGRFGEVSIPEGVIEGGQIKNSEKLREVLFGLAKKYSISFVRAALPEERLYFFRTRVDKGTMEEMRTTLELSLEEHVPIPAFDAIFDFDVVEEFETENEVAVTASSRELVEAYAKIFADAGMTLLSLELEAQAIMRSVVSGEDELATLIVDFGETRTGLSICHKGQVRFTSTVSVGGRTLTEVLAKNFKISMEEAEKMKREYGLQRNSPHQDLFALLLNNIAVLRDEINKHFIYWHTHKDEAGNDRPPIGQILLVGGNSNLSGLSDYLSTSLRTKTVIGDVWVNAPFPQGSVPPLPKKDSLSYATAIGLALKDHE